VMVNPGIFKGTRLEFVQGEHANYAKAVLEGRATEELADIICQFFKRFPISLPDNEEPSVEDLANVNDKAPDTE
ncbi:hypothetical protein ARMSODRAFT_860064, partial [Armillaria solidipes]